MIIGIDGTRSRSGGAIGYLKNIFENGDPRDFGISEVHLWAAPHILDAIPDRTWLKPHSIGSAADHLLREVFWQRTKLPKELDRTGCNLLYIPNGVSVCRYKPQVAMCRDLLCFEPGQRELYPWHSKQQIRLRLNRWLQLRTYSNAEKVIFLSEYARDLVAEYLDDDPEEFPIIPHGVNREQFYPSEQSETRTRSTLKITYVSNLDAYKHQWNVIEGVAAARVSGVQATLNLVGNMDSPFRERLESAMNAYDPEGEWINLAGQRSSKEVGEILRQSDAFLYASSCENLPNSLIEAMASGLPILSSDKGPMPSILNETAILFDPFSPVSIKDAIMLLAAEPEQMTSLGKKTYELSKAYSWSNSANQLWKTLGAGGANG
ncbi:Glycosyltransferase involved in cell wall bisynthesis [Parasphingorhabdus marina DSM 22363]|uniref:Glycosyltransferase involved in cell wall bisynthesis n=1 Tax=Parasphingorhabdus marina DSM 22363 TaxID=1123272 RepID=A0A1N6HQD4_9SPHN|nr:glycosyltransferase [Parasphingorhabdus marina]SIO21973.1 Glycosyltransferase involved in cell wall bisynthesis [Parasphingorhabdus marina DSM 22363]